MTIGSESFRLQPGSLVFAAADEVLTLELAPKTERFVLCIKEGFLAASSDPFLLRRLCLFGRSGGPRSVRLGPSDRGWISERLSSMQAELGRLEAQSRTILAAQLVETL